MDLHESRVARLHENLRATEFLTHLPAEALQLDCTSKN